ncbi:hypothetical protein OC846_003958 [Tilletia horrida]|uniref:Uncharacterized protein n=1 Tax=Tilletia horrida TaxID=155126 RepID=A0AAN6GNP0_9BASI|nr:hypothetical protein OC845_003971 [Tilletia horrida]KAK0549720.1 hypothetical protein OC846_003958 [Tilletia horrida]
MIVPSVKSLLVSVVLSATLALAATDGPYHLGQAPVNFQKDVLNTTLSCSVTAAGKFSLTNQQIGFGFAAYVPSRLNVSQPFTFTLTNRLIIPQSLSSKAASAGASYYNGTITSLVVNLDGASVGSIDAVKGKTVNIPTTAVNSNGVGVVLVPGAGKSIRVGPITTSSEGNVMLNLGQISANITYLDKNKKPAFTAQVSCPASQYSKLPFSLIGIGGNAYKTQVDPNTINVIPTIPADKLAVTSGVGYYCDFAQYPDQPIRVSFGAVRPSNAGASYKEPIYLTNAQANVVLSAALVGQIVSVYTWTRVFNFNITTFNLVAVGANPSVLNLAPASGWYFKGVPAAGGSTITIPAGAPNTTLPDIKFNPTGSPATNFRVGVADLSGTVELCSTPDNSDCDLEQFR